MKAADLAVLVFFLVLAGGAAGAFYWWQGQEAQAAEARCEAGIDEMVDGKIRAVQLDFLAPQLAASSDRLAALQALYAEPARSDHLNLVSARSRASLPPVMKPLLKNSGETLSATGFSANWTSVGAMARSR